jgi:N-formylglutamate deformylase
MKDKVWTLIEGDGPLVATAIHDGHALRDELVALSALSEPDRLREEDPFTGGWTAVAENRIVVSKSRFEVDLNRPRERAVYRRPEDAWGLNLWKAPLPREVIERSHSVYDAFYSEVARVLKKIERRHGRFVVFDLHSYNHRREGPSGPEADPKANPEVNIGTGAMPEGRWEGIVSRFMSDLSSYNFLGRRLDVRENVKFRGGNFPRWVHSTFPDTGCAIAVEFKKFFMDEWTGEPDSLQVKEIHKAIASTIPGILKELAKIT